MKKVLGLALMFLLLQTAAFAQSLRRQADRIGILVGTAVNPLHFKETSYASTLAREFNMIEPENVLKWGTVRPSQDTFNFKPGDEVVAFAQAHKMKVRGHTLLWAKYNPGWLVNGHFTPEQLSQLMQKHITTVVKHYAGQVFAWDVVNEAFDANGRLEHSIWYDSPGVGLMAQETAYIEQAFRLARAADPNALLFYNDYDAEGLNKKSNAIYAMVKDFKHRGVPIDGVGLQMHIFNLSTKNVSQFAANIARLSALGVQVHITEMDVGLPIDARGNLKNEADIAKQAEIYRFVMTTCLQQRACTAFQTWGFTDKYTWIPEYSKGKIGQPLLFDQNYAPKPAYQTILDVMEHSTR